MTYAMSEVQESPAPTRSRPEVVEHAGRLAQALREHAHVTDGLVQLLSDLNLTSIVVEEVESDTWKGIWAMSLLSHESCLNQFKLADELDAFYEETTP